MRIVLVICFLIVFGELLNAQVVINRTGDNPHPDAMLDIQDTTKALIIPRVALRSIVLSTPLNSFAAGMVIYNTATSGVGSSAVTPGLYYSDGIKWIRATSQGSVSDTSIYNSDGTLSGNRVVKLQNNNLTFNSTSGNLLFTSLNGKVGIGTSTPLGTLHVKGSVYIDSLQSGAVTDSILTVDKTTGRIRAISPANMSGGIKKVNYTVSINGQTNFTTPLSVFSADNVQLYRNGILIDFAVPVIGGNIIIAEIPCLINDEILIIQKN